MSNFELDCLIGYAFFGAMLLTSISIWARKEKNEFIQTLDAEQKEMYDRIFKERLQIWVTGSIAGLITGWLVVKGLGSADGNKTKNGCMFLAVAFFTQYVWYTMWPKSNWMAYHLKDMNQVKEWYDVYRAYSTTWGLGLGLGVVGYFLIGRGIKN